jgi:PAS domain S-box-containing protein
MDSKLSLLDTISIRAKVLIAFLLVIAVTAGLGVFALVRLDTVTDVAITLRDDSLPSTILTARLESSAKQYRLVEARHIRSNSPTRMDANEQDLKAVEQGIEKLRATYEPLIAAGTERDLLSTFDRQWKEYVDLHATTLLPLLRRNEGEKAEQFFNGRSYELFMAMITTLGEIVEFNVAEANDTTSDGELIAASARRWIIAAMAFTAMLCAAFGWIIVISVSRPIAGMTQVMRRLAGRDMTVEIVGLGRKDEIGDMAKAVDVFRQNMIRAEELAAELRASEKWLSREKQHLARAQRVASMLSYQVDLRTGRFEWSDGACRIFGIERQALPATLDEFKVLMPQDDLKRMRETITQAQKQGGAIPPLESHIRRPDGSVRIIYREVERVLDSAGKPTGLFGIIRDVTELRDAERQRNEFERQMHEAQKMEALGTLAGGIAHDLNNALVPVVMLSDMLLEDSPQETPNRALLALIKEGGHRARTLVQQILIFTRRDEPKRELLDITAVVGNALKLLRSTLPTTISIDARMASTPLIVADDGQIHQVLMNLVTNAAHAIGDHMGTITIEIAEVSNAPPDGDAAVRLSVTDTGCGMDEATRKKIFDPFFTTKPVNEGTGLGLSVVHGIVTNHKGAITVESAPGQGTRFDVYFPVITEEVAAVEATAA